MDMAETEWDTINEVGAAVWRTTARAAANSYRGLAGVVRTSRPVPLAFAVILAALVIWHIQMTFEAVLHVFSGELFLASFDRAHIGGALDQPTITKGYFIFLIGLIVVLPYVAMARLAINRTTRLGYRVFAVPAIAVCVYLMAMLAIPFYWTIQYIGAMGITPRRVESLLFGLVCYGIVTVFLRWAIRPPQALPETEEASVPSANRDN